MILALAAYHGWQVHHLDVKSTFLHGDLKEEVYVTQPEGFVQQGNSGKVYKLTKALYGLRQAPRAWNVKLDQTLKSLDFKKCNLEQAVYTKRSKTSTLIVGVYVDDLIITGTPRKEIDLFKSQMKDKFEMSDLGLLAYYLGIEVTQTGGEITIKQTGYINKILKETSMMDSNDTKIPMDPGTKLVKAEDGNSVDATYYRSLIGSLRYLLHTRPDLSYSVGLLSRFMQDPKDHHLKAIKQVIRYIKGTKEHGIIYKKEGGCKITGYSDSSYGINTDQGKGTTGIVFYFGESPITWCTQKQPTVALSSCESEFMAATGAACQALWLKRLLSELTGWEEKRITLKVDNISAIALVRNPVFHGRSKHIDIRYHFIRECVENGHINVEHVSGELQRADILTKALPRLKIWKRNMPHDDIPNMFGRGFNLVKDEYKMSTGLPIEISSSMKSQNYTSFCRLDIDIHCPRYSIICVKWRLSLRMPSSCSDLFQRLQREMGPDFMPKTAVKSLTSQQIVRMHQLFRQAKFDDPSDDNSYKINQTQDKIRVFVSIVSTKIPFKGTGNEYIGDDISEIANAVKTCLRQCCSQLKTKIVKKIQAREQQERKRSLTKYLNDAAGGIYTILKVASDLQAKKKQHMEIKDEDAEVLQKVSNRLITKETLIEKLALHVEQVDYKMAMEYATQSGVREEPRENIYLQSLEPGTKFIEFISPNFVFRLFQ
ncbi:zinc finger, CCHC-type containing protein [Tanacetum coccineum]